MQVTGLLVPRSRPGKADSVGERVHEESLGTHASARGRIEATPAARRASPDPGEEPEPPNRWIPAGLPVRLASGQILVAWLGGATCWSSSRTCRSRSTAASGSSARQGRHGFEVSVICSKGPGDPGRETIDGVHIRKYRPAPQASGLHGCVLEFICCWPRTARLSRKVWRRRPFQVIQACNSTRRTPIARPALAATRCAVRLRPARPQPRAVRVPVRDPSSLAGRLRLAGLRWLERRTYAADHVISTNESYRRILQCTPLIEHPQGRPEHRRVGGSDPRVDQPPHLVLDAAETKDMLSIPRR